MTDINHTRKNRRPVNQRHEPHEYHHGQAPAPGKKRSSPGIGKTDYLDKSGRGWTAIAPLSGERISASIPNDFVNGHQGMAKAVKGAKKFVRTRVRFHENAETKSLALEASDPAMETAD